MKIEHPDQLKSSFSSSFASSWAQKMMQAEIAFFKRAPHGYNH